MACLPYFSSANAKRARRKRIYQHLTLKKTAR